ncbi:MAG: hypothetical protein ACKVU4_15615 [Phycisphaerales bacterium]
MKVMMRSVGAAACAAAIGWVFAPAALGQVAALDRVPAGTPIVIAVPSLARFQAAMNTVAQTFGMPMDFGPMAEMSKAVNLAGLNQNGSAALAIMAGEDGRVDFENEPPMVLLLPVSDYAKFIEAGGGDASAAVAEVDPFEEGEPAYAKNLGGGYVAMGPDKDVIEAFKGAPGNAAAHKAFLGANGGAAVDASALSIVASIQALSPDINQAMEGFKQQLAMVAEMGGGNMAGQVAAMEAFVTALTRDGQSVVLGFGVGDTGMSLNLAAQFKEGSEAAGFLAAKGAAGGLLDRVPNQPYLFAFAMDTSSAGIKALMKKATQGAANADPEAAKAMGLTDAMMKQLDSVDGMSMMMGVSPAMMMTGLFANSTLFVKTKDAKGYAAAMKDMCGKMDGQTVQGFTYKTSYATAAKKVEGVTVDEWSLKMEPDPNDPAAAQAMMAMSAVFGPEGGFNGYIAPAESGLVFTYAKNDQLLGQALAAAKGGGLGADAGVKTVDAALPSDRTLEGYIGIGQILDMVMGFAAMVGGPALNVEIPDDLPPIGMGASTHSGGARMVVFAPTRVLTTIQQLIQEAQQGADGNPGNPAGQPRF